MSRVLLGAMLLISACGPLEVDATQKGRPEAAKAGEDQAKSRVDVPVPVDLPAPEQPKGARTWVVVPDDPAGLAGALVADPRLPKRLATAAEAGARTEILPNGAFAVDFVLPRVDKKGGTWRLSDRVNPQGTGDRQGVLLAFMTSWCGYCKLSLPTLKSLQEAHGDALSVVIVSMDSNEAAAKKEAEVVVAAGLSVPVVHATEEVIAAWLGDNRAPPRYLFLNALGEIMVRDMGYGNKVGPLMPKQAAFVLGHPEYVDRTRH